MTPVPLWPGINAGLNGLAACCIVVGLVAIRRRAIKAHKAAMVTALSFSVVFLISYLTYHARGLVTAYPSHVAGKGAYFALLISHTCLAVPVAIMAPVSVWLGLTNRIDRHRTLATITAPMWLYVSVTGVIVYVWLYWIAGARPGAA